MRLTQIIPAMLLSITVMCPTVMFAQDADKKDAPAPTPAVGPDAPDAPDAPDQPDQPTVTTPAVAPPATPKYRPVPAEAAIVSTLGSVDPETGYKLEVKLSGWGGSVYRIRLVEYTDIDSPPVENANTSVDVDNDSFDNRLVPVAVADQAAYREKQQKAFIVQQAQQAVGGKDDGNWFYPYRPLSITINGTTVDLTIKESARWHYDKPGQYSITIVDAADNDVVKITRKYRLAKDSYLLECDQKIENLTDAALKITWSQKGQVDLTQNIRSHIGDRRAFVMGYYNLAGDPNRKLVWTDDAFINRDNIVGGDPLWHGNSRLPLPEQRELVWIAAVNRYFSVATSAQFNPESKDPVASLDSLFASIKPQFRGGVAGETDKRALIIELTTDEFELAAGSSKELNISVFTGPRRFELLNEAPYSKLGLSKVIRFNLGGPCSFCTFQWLAEGLLKLLKFFHLVFRDWGMAIILLVCLVRLLLHPITKKSQINMTRLGKQMSELQPEMEKLKKKYANNQKMLNTEMMKLYREKGVNPANMLGCAPMFLQMPIWIALYAMLYFAIELRQEPGFYGIFQLFGEWQFLSDLSMPDRFIIFFDEPTYITFLIKFDYSSFNILPLVMGVFWFFQQKLMTPPAANEQAAQQQKIMRVMTLMFPFFLYSAPSGLTLYIMASSILGTIDSLIVRRHIKREEEAGTLLQKKAPKKGGIRDTMGKLFDQKRQELLAKEDALRGKKGRQSGQKRKPKKRR